MDDPFELFLSAQRAFTERVHAVTEDQWQLPTPAGEWNVADLVAHLVKEHRYAAPLLHGQDLATAGMIVEGSRSLPVDGGIGANLAEEWDEAAVGSADAFSADGALGRTVDLSRGATPALAYLAEMAFDLVVHGWDLATAIGFDGELPDDAVDYIYAMVQDMDLSAYGEMFAPPVDVPDDAPTIDKLVGLSGRNPR